MTLAVMMIVAVEKSVEAGFGVVEHLRFGEGAAGGDDFEAGFFEDFVMRAGGVLEAGGG